jgi:lipooligosaccharide transport system permease protein
VTVITTVRDAPALRAATIFFARFRESGISTLLLAALNPLFVLGALGLGLGSLIDGDATRSLGGVDYLAFLAPGLMAAVAMQGAAGESMWPVLGGIKWDGTYLAQIATPLRPADVLMGQLTFTTLRLSIGIVMTFASMVLYGAVESWWGVLAMPAALLTGIAYAAPITAFAATQETDTAFPLIMRLGVIPSYLFSGTFFPVSQLPRALRAVAEVTPLWHGVDLCRSLSLGRATLLGSIGHVAYLCAFVVASLALARRTLTKRLHA